MILTPSIETYIQSSILDIDRDTGVEVERTADEDIVYIKAAGTDVLAASSTLVEFNPDQGSVDVVFRGVLDEVLLYVSGATAGIGFHTDQTTFPRGGQVIQSAFLALKPDFARWNSAAFIMYSSNALRTTDVSILKGGGTEDSPLPLTIADDLCNLRIEGMDSDGNFQPAVLMQASVYDTVASGVVSGTLYVATMDNLGVITQRQSWDYDNIDFWLGNHRMQANGNVLINTDQLADATFRVYSENDVNAIRVRSNGISAGEDSIGFFVGTPNSRIGFGGSIGYKITTVSTATATLGNSDYIINVSRTSTGTCALALPSAASVWQNGSGVGRGYFIWDYGCNAAANNITVTRNGTDTIRTNVSGATVATISQNGYGLWVQVVNSTTWKAMILTA